VFVLKKNKYFDRHQWLTPIVLASQGAGMEQKVLDPISKIPNTKQGWWSGSSDRMPA
jgi:hypothetical protein